MSVLPSGTVTFLFTDIEGSTRLLHEHGERYGELLAGHREALRAAFADQGGVDVDTRGDAFFYTFSRARDALATASQAQAALAAGPVAVRIEIHTGEPLPSEEGYVGMDLHRAARICAAGPRRPGFVLAVDPRPAGALGRAARPRLGRFDSCAAPY